MPNGSTLVAAIVVSAAVSLVSCSVDARPYSTWESLGQRPGKTAYIPEESVPPPHVRPWAGTVSHHLLAHSQIDGWFRELAKRRDVKRFYILSPSHWGLSTQPFSVTDGSWRVGNGFVESDRGTARALAGKLGVPLEPRVFEPEHGVSTLIPFIARHFPRAKVVAIAYYGEPPLDQPMAERLYAALAPFFGQRGRQSDFLIVSTDFSHHGNTDETIAKDLRSREFFDDPSFTTWISAGCDNRPGMYALSRLLDSESRSAVLYHCNSLELSGHGEDDITSYFFSYFW